MNVTIINNGKTKLVLKATSPQEILAIKELQDKPLVSAFHESTQILDESTPSCLVISSSTTEKVQKTDLQLMAIIDSHQQNAILGLIPRSTPPAEILYFLKTILNAEKVALDTDQKIVVNEVFKTITTIEGGSSIVNGEYAVIDAPTFLKW